MEQLIFNLQNLLASVWGVLISVFVLVLPWMPLIAWIAFWLLAVNWGKLYPVLAKGGMVGVILIGLMWILVWGLIAPPPGGTHFIAGLKLANFVGKTVYVTSLVSIMLLCGSVQLSGACGSLIDFKDEPIDDHGHGDHDSSHDGHAHSHH